MNKDQIKGNWKQLKGTVKSKWAKLTDDDVAEIEGNAEILAGKIQEKYGYAREKAEEQVREWEKEHRKNWAA